MINDTTLVKQAQQNSREFVHIYDRYIACIYAYAVRELGDEAMAQDVVATTFEKGLRQLHRLRQPERLRSWLYTIARNEIRRLYNRQKWFVPLQDRFSSPINVENQVSQQVVFEHVIEVLHQLAQRDQEILRLHFFEALSHSEIAHILNCSNRNVAVRLHRALQRLRQQVQQTEGETTHDLAG